MKKVVSEKESVLLGYSPQSQRYLFANHNNSGPSSSSRRDAEIDFRDVFGGPPRRSTIQEARHSFNGSRGVDDEEDDEDEDDNEAGNDEKPVFGEGGGVNARRRYPNEDFFGDIFKGKELLSLSCSPRSKHSLSSAPGSRVLSPVRPLPPRADQQQLLLGGSDSPAQFSLPSRVTELPTFGSPTRNQHKNKDSGSNASGNYSHSPLSRPSSQANINRAQEALESNVRLRTYLSRELSLGGSDELLDLEKPEAMETAIKLERRSSAVALDGSHAQGKGGQFHFSIYKWASKGSPLEVPLRAGKGLGSKEKGKVPSSSSFNGWLNGEEMAKRSPRVTPDDQSSDKQKDGSSADARNPNRVDQVNDAEEATASLPQRKSESSRTHQVAVMKLKNVETEAVHSLAKMELSKGKVESSFVVIKEAPKTELKPVWSMFDVSEHEPGNDTVAKSEGSKGSKVKSTKKVGAVFDVREDVKKGPDKSVNVYNGNVKNARIEVSKRSLGSSISKNKGGGGKVKEFVKIFNQELPGKPEVDVESQRQNTGRKEIGKPMTPDAISAKSTGIGKELNFQIKDKVVDASILVNENPTRSEKQQPETITYSTTNTVSTPASATSLPGSAPEVSEAIIEELDDCFDDNFLMEEILEDDHKLPEETSAKSEAEEIKAIDDKIRNWSRGKEGNIRSLLSTLQYVLWPGSGWKNVPLVDIVEGNTVRRPYQKALLCLHPDKLQQKGATAHQKYMAEKVFDILQEAWTQFNSLGSV